MKMIPDHFCIEIQGSTARQFELLCAEYGMDDELLLSYALRLVEQDLAEFEARRLAIQGNACDEA